MTIGSCMKVCYNSVDMIESMDQDFWDRHHARHDSTWLTGSSLDRYLDFFRLSVDHLRGQRVLEIGVGLGQATKQLGVLCGELHCADISAVALNRVRDHVTQAYVTQELESVPPVDVVLCFLVTVHCPDQEVIRMIDHTQLVPTGRLYVQFSGPMADGDIPERAHEHFVANGTHWFRTREEIEQLIDQTNKRIVQILAPQRVYHDGWFVHDWHPVILQNR